MNDNILASLITMIVGVSIAVLIAIAMYTGYTYTVVESMRYFKAGIFLCPTTLTITLIIAGKQLFEGLKSK